MSIVSTTRKTGWRKSKRASAVRVSRPLANKSTVRVYTMTATNHDGHSNDGHKRERPPKKSMTATRVEVTIDSATFQLVMYGDPFRSTSVHDVCENTR